MQTLLQDLRFALRQIVRNPGFSITSILSLTLGIGATVAVYSILYSAVLHPWPYAGMDRICNVWLTDGVGREIGVDLTGPQVRQLRQARSVEDVVATSYTNEVVTGSDVPDDVIVVGMTGTHFAFLGMHPLLGRYFDSTDAPDGKDPQPVAVLGYKFWQRHYRGDPSVVGRTIQVNHKSYTILGVMPVRFTWSDGEVYTPLNMASSQDHLYSPTIKLKPGVSLAAAEAEFQPLFQQFARETPNIFPKQFQLSVRRLADTYTRDLKKVMVLLFGAVALLLAIGCGNLSILLLARGTARQHEFAIRSAVGASGVRIVRQLLTESLLLALVGAGLGVVAAYRAIAFLVPRLPEQSYPYEADFHINLPVLCFSVFLSIACGIVFGLFPALQSARPEINQVMQAGARRVSGSVRGKRLHMTLIAGQIALTLLILTAAGAAMEAFLTMLRVPLGYQPQHVISLPMPMADDVHTTWADRVSLYSTLRDKIAAMPGVRSVAISTNATPPDSGWRQPVEILGAPGAASQNANLELVGSQYFATLQIPLRSGRLWTESEVYRGATMVLVNDSFVRHYLSGGAGVGHSVRFPLLASPPPGGVAAPGAAGWIEIIGVVGDSLNDGLDKPVQPAVYAPYALLTFPAMQILVRTQGNPFAMLHSIKQQIASVDADQQVMSDVRDLEGWIEHEPEYARGRLVSMLFAWFSILALVLAAVGLYSVVSYTLQQRTSELGVRIALGAQRRDVLRIVGVSMGTGVGLGILAGLVLSFGLNRLIAQWIEHGTRDPLVVLGASALLLVVAVLASLVPARRALTISPIQALRSE